MSGTTAVYALRWQDLLDPPHGPNLGKNLAEDVEDELVRIDADITALDTDSGLVNVTAATGWAVNAEGFTVRKIGKLVMIRFDLDRTGANLGANVSSTLGTLTTDYRPPHNVSIACGNGSTGLYARSHVASTGVVTVQNHASINTGHDLVGAAMWFVT